MTRIHAAWGILYLYVAGLVLHTIIYHEPPHVAFIIVALVAVTVTMAADYRNHP